MTKSINLMARNKVTFLMLSLTLIVGGISAQAAGTLNSDAGGYLVCVNSKTKVVTHPGTAKCAKGDKALVIGAQGTTGITGATGLSGKDGRDGADGKTLWNGVIDPENSWGAPGDVYINSVTKTLFGPKNIDGTWPAGIALVGPQGERGLIGLTGATGSQGPGGSGPQGPAGATGATGPAGTNGTNGSNATLTCAQGGTCVIGDTGPGGGKVFYITPTPFTTATPWRYMEVAPPTWFGSSEPYDIAWCSNVDTFVPPLTGPAAVPATIQTSDAIGQGFSNTQKMLRGCTYGAAQAATSYHGGGQNNWFLPSKNELMEWYKKSTITLGFGIDYDYRSSSEYASNEAWTQNFYSIDRQGHFGKNGQAYVRPVRSF